ncbi:MAG: glycosyltransferase family 4 protein [Frankiaceae bacterium]|nr:glycosyltransferase family 4 protein [Frankiaceae bacterium]
MLAPIAWRVPPRHYGPWELVVSRLTEGLVARGVDVTLFATGDSVTAATLSSVAPRPYEEDPSYDVKVVECLHIAAAFERAADFDVLHNHFDFLPLSYSRLVGTPLVTTVHGLSSPGILPAYREYDDTVAYVAISQADRHPDLTYAATVHHGIPVQDVPLGTGSSDGTLVFLGRIHPDKGTAEAVEVARRSGRPLVIAGIVQDEAYFQEQVLPHVDGERVRYVGPVGPQERDRLLGDADALLHLVRFAEPFGLSMVEAMACGTPVVAVPLGSVPEVVADGVTGWLVDDVEAAVGAVGRLDELDRAACRRRVVERFSVERMVEGYLRVYEELVR